MDGWKRILGTGMALAGLAAGVPAAAQNVANGEALYKGVCIACHGLPPVGGPERGAANNPTFIANAINKVVSMSFLKGTYTFAELTDIAAFIAVALSVTPPPTGPALDYTDLWYNASESGWGFNIIQHEGSNNIFGVIYTYEAPNRPLWLVLPGGTWNSSTIFQGTLYRVSGPPFNQPFDPAQTVVRQVGIATLTFTSAGTATLVYSVDGVSVIKTIVRQPY